MYISGILYVNIMYIDGQIRRHLGILAGRVGHLECYDAS